mgnify:CR=1 FL=1
MEYFIIALIAMMWGWREFVKSMRLNTIEQELEGIRIWTEKKDPQFLEIQNQVNVLVQKVDKKQNNDANVSGDDSRILRSSGERLNNEFSDEISESSPNNLVASCSEDISSEKKRTFFLVLLFSNSFEIFEAIFVANAVLPIDGLPAIIIKSDLCRPPIFLSKSLKPVFRPVSYTHLTLPTKA